MTGGSTPKVRIAILASGGGSNAECLMAHFAEGSGSEVGEVVWVGTNRMDAGVRAHARRHGIPESHVSKQAMNSGELLTELRERGVEWIALAGFLLRLPAEICEAYHQKLVNIHPALLPKHGGKGMFGMHVHRAVHASGDLRSGMTIHWVRPEYDEGDILFQGEVALVESDSPEDIAGKVLALEHRHYPPILEGIIRLSQGTDVRDATHLQSHKR